MSIKTLTPKARRSKAEAEHKQAFVLAQKEAEAERRLAQQKIAALEETAARPQASGHVSRVADYFEAKLEAEWGPYDLKRALDKDPQSVVVLDTRMPEAFKEEHIPQAINIPTEALERRLSELPKDKAIVPYCWNITCHLATRAALLLARKGFCVHELAGGIDMWKSYKFPVESGAPKGPIPA